MKTAIKPKNKWADRTTNLLEQSLSDMAGNNASYFGETADNTADAKANAQDAELKTTADDAKAKADTQAAELKTTADDAKAKADTQDAELKAAADAKAKSDAQDAELKAAADAKAKADAQDAELKAAADAKAKADAQYAELKAAADAKAKADAINEKSDEQVEKRHAKQPKGSEFMYLDTDEKYVFIGGKFISRFTKAKRNPNFVYSGVHIPANLHNHFMIRCRENELDALEVMALLITDFAERGVLPKSVLSRYKKQA